MTQQQIGAVVGLSQRGVSLIVNDITWKEVSKEVDMSSRYAGTGAQNIASPTDQTGSR